MKKTILYTIITLAFMSGCTQLVTAPISIASSAVGATLNVAGSAVGAVTGSDD